MLKDFARSIRSGARATYDEFLFSRHQRRSRIIKHETLPFFVLGDYLITTDKGIFHLRGSHLAQVCNLPAFGISISEEDVYLASWTSHYSIILKGSLRALLEEGWPYSFEELYRVPICSSAMRVHQICARGDYLWLANTARNTLTKLNRHHGAWLAEIAPFTDMFGTRITTDHNHVNSVTLFDNCLMFVAHSIAKQSLVGVCGKGLLRGYAYSNLGGHDIHIRGESFYFSDSYRFNEEGAGGILVVNWQPFDPGFHANAPQQFIRGVAGYGDETVIGSSVVGTREERYKGEGKLLIATGVAITHEVRVAAAQIHDVLLTDGSHFDTPPIMSDFDSICTALKQHLGEPVLELSLTDALVSEKGKKYDERDLGDIRELLY